MALSVVDVVARAAVRHPMPAVMYELLSVNESLPGAMTVLPAIIRLDADLERRLADVSRGDGSWRERTASRTLERGLAEIGFRRVHSAALLITAMKALPIETRAFDYLDFGGTRSPSRSSLPPWRMHGASRGASTHTPPGSSTMSGD